MKQSYVYNVLVMGFSVGLTFDLREAQAWAGKDPKAKIVAVKYTKPESV